MRQGYHTLMSGHSTHPHLHAAPTYAAVQANCMQASPSVPNMMSKVMSGASGANAFVYGTLMADEVVSKLIQRIPAQQPALLHGFRRHRLEGVVYPAIVPSSDSAVQGKVLMDLTAAEVSILDVYEAHEYYRETVQPIAPDGSQITAEVYIWKPEYNDRLLPEDWDYEKWRESNLYLWVDELEPMEAHPTGEVMGSM